VEQHSHVFDELRASVRNQMAQEIIEGIQGLEVHTYLEAQTVNKAIEVVKGAIGIAQ
jgi:hypothetical protein